jgi:hypothetical protein
MAYDKTKEAKKSIVEYNKKKKQSLDMLTDIRKKNRQIK